MERCPWAGNDPLYIKYHDLEWGIPVYDDQKLFEFLVLESAQAGLSWITILKRREGYRLAYDDFQVEIVANYDDAKVQELFVNPGIIRNKKKIESSISNAQLFMKVQETYGSFSQFLWSYVNHQPIVNHYRTMAEVPATTPLSDQISKDMKKLGFKFIGSTIIYAYMQAIGMVHDHLITCPCHVENLEGQ